MITEVRMKRAMAGMVAAGLILTGAGTALAAQKGRVPVLTSAGVAFERGTYKFNPPGTDHGSFEWAGDLSDAYPEDGHNVYVQIGVEGHGWARYYGKQRSTVRLRHSDWSGAQRYTDNAKLRVCRDRGSLRPDNCSPTKRFAYTLD